MKTQCCIVGGGPAGVMLGYLLARSGIHVTVLEKHKDFFRDFRGDTVHPSTLEVLYELDLLDAFLAMPHQEMETVGVVYGHFSFTVADCRYLPTHCKFVALMPQWDLLSFLSNAARRFKGFEMRMEHEGVDLKWENKRVVGVRVRTPEGLEEIEADLTIACDGRHSTMRESALMPVTERGVPIDVLWFRISRKGTDSSNVLGNLNYGKALILINRGEYFQAALIIKKGSFPAIQQAGMDVFRRNLLLLVPEFEDRVHEIESFDHIKLLTVQINRLESWSRPGFLCIGDAAHAMSPAGGVGINLAIQDAVATANILAPILLRGRAHLRDLQRVQRRRHLPTVMTQWAQANVHKVFEAVFRTNKDLTTPWQLRAVAAIPGLPRLAGRMVGIGVRPEHVEASVRGRQAKVRSRLIFAIAVTCTLGIVAARLITRRRV